MFKKKKFSLQLTSLTNQTFPPIFRILVLIIRIYKSGQGNLSNGQDLIIKHQLYLSFLSYESKCENI